MLALPIFVPAGTSETVLLSLGPLPLWAEFADLTIRMAPSSAAPSGAQFALCSIGTSEDQLASSDLSNLRTWAKDLPFSDDLFGVHNFTLPVPKAHRWVVVALDVDYTPFAANLFGYACCGVSSSGRSSASVPGRPVLPR